MLQSVGTSTVALVGLLMLLLCLFMLSYLLSISVLIIIFLDLYVLSTLNSMQHYHHTF